MTFFDLVAVALVLGAALAMLLLLRIFARHAPGGPEWLRKLAHLGTGALAIVFPWIFSSAQPVWIVCGLSIGLLASIRFVPPVRNRFSGVLDSVNRISWGEFYFPVSVAILFWLARGDKLLYIIPILVLTLADTVAALLGTHYGKFGYGGIGGTKSVEGSVAFFTVAFFAIHVPLLLLTEMGRPQTLLVATDIALIVTLLEAVAWSGLDNLFIPLGVFLLLHIYITMPLRLLLFRLTIALVLLVFTFLYRSRTTLEGSALLASVLALYASWAIGGWRWLLPPLIVFCSYSLFYPGRIKEIERRHNVYAVSSVASAGLFWIYVAHLRSNPSILFPYTLGFAIHLILLGWTLSCLRNPTGSVWKAGPLVILEGWFLLFTPYVLANGVSWHGLLLAGISLPVCGLAFLLFCWIEPRKDGLYSDGPRRWLRQAALVFSVTGLVAGIQELR